VSLVWGRRICQPASETVVVVRGHRAVGRDAEFAGERLHEQASGRAALVSLSALDTLPGILAGRFRRLVKIGKLLPDFRD
jgi:hypothetical protein